MGSRIYVAGRIRLESYSEQTWWFHNRDWRPGDWIRASLTCDQHQAYGGDFIYEEPTEYHSMVQVVSEWSETKTPISVSDGRGRAQRPSVVHHVTFKMARGSRPWFITPRFLVVN